MSTSKTVKVYKGIPTRISAKAEGIYDHSEFQTFESSDSVTLETEVYDGLNYTIDQSSNALPIIDFSNTILPNHKKTKNEKYIFSPVMNGALYFDVEKQRYIDNYDIVGKGSLTVDENNVASGFSTSNYVIYRKMNRPFGLSSDWEVQMKFTAGDIISNDSLGLFHSPRDNSSDGRFGIGLYIDKDEKTFNYFVSSDGSTWLFDLYGTTKILPNTTYWVKFGWTGTVYYLDYSLDGSEYTREITFESTESVYSSLNRVLIGVYSMKDIVCAFDGSIDLSSIKIRLNGVFDGSSTGRVNYNNKIASGFTSTSYLVPSANTPYSGNHNYIVLNGRITEGSVINTIMSREDDANYYWYIDTNNHLAYYQSDSIKSIGTTTIELNKDYWFVIKAGGAWEFDMYLAEDDGTYTKSTLPPLSDTDFWTLEGSSRSGINTNYIRSNKWKIGQNSNNNSYFHGSINLDKCFTSTSSTDNNLTQSIHSYFIKDSIDYELCPLESEKRFTYTSEDIATDDNGVLSNFIRGISTTSNVVNKQSTIEICVKFKPGTDLSGQQRFYSWTDSSKGSGSTIYMSLGSSDGYLVGYFLSNGLQGSGAIIKLTADQWYWVRVRYFPNATTKDGKSYSAKTLYYEYSTNGFDFITGYYCNMSSYFFSNSSTSTTSTTSVWGYEYIGGEQYAASLRWKGSVDSRSTFAQSYSSKSSIKRYSLPGSIYKFDDNGESSNVNVYSVNNDIVLSPENSLVGYPKIGTINIPEHNINYFDLYRTYLFYQDGSLYLDYSGTEAKWVNNEKTLEAGVTYQIRVVSGGGASGIFDGGAGSYWYGYLTPSTTTTVKYIRSAGGIVSKNNNINSLSGVDVELKGEGISILCKGGQGSTDDESNSTHTYAPVINITNGTYETISQSTDSVQQFSWISNNEGLNVGAGGLNENKEGGMPGEIIIEKCYPLTITTTPATATARTTFYDRFYDRTYTGSIGSHQYFYHTLTGKNILIPESVWKIANGYIEIDTENEDYYSDNKRINLNEGQESYSVDINLIPSTLTWENDALSLLKGTLYDSYFAFEYQFNGEWDREDEYGLMMAIESWASAKETPENLILIQDQNGHNINLRLGSVMGSYMPIALLINGTELVTEYGDTVLDPWIMCEGNTTGKFLVLLKKPKEMLMSSYYMSENHEPILVPSMYSEMETDMTNLIAAFDSQLSIPARGTIDNVITLNKVGFIASANREAGQAFNQIWILDGLASNNNNEESSSSGKSEEISLEAPTSGDAM